jgi:hypothetical protein
MASAIEEYEKLAAQLCAIEGVASGQMFGKACLKVHGKAFVAQHKECVVFKLGGPHHGKAMSAKGAALWDPSGKGRPMKEWVAVPAAGNKNLTAFAVAALDHVAAAAA